ncbi:hypothetical protein [Allokutzneria oryzae]|uniref:Secreted protein n=1 Tax=Allokutzneria oryzae TaxID=1378989 RepID=A0ABV6A8H4_9PSEU
MKRASFAVALAAVLTVGMATPASAATISRFSSADGEAWGSVTWGKFSFNNYPMTLDVHYRPKQGHGRVGVQVEVALRGLPNFDWKYFVGPDSHAGHRKQTTVFKTGAPVSGIRLRVCRKLMDGSNKCGKPTKLYASGA